MTSTLTPEASSEHAASEAVRKAALAHAASKRMAGIDTGTKNAALLRIADALEAATDRILAVNGPEVERGRERGLTGSFIDRMVLTPERIAAIAREPLLQQEEWPAATLATDAIVGYAQAAVERSIQEGQCTFAATGASWMPQPYYVCRTCRELHSTNSANVGCSTCKCVFVCV